MSDYIGPVETVTVRNGNHLSHVTVQPFLRPWEENATIKLDVSNTHGEHVSITLNMSEAKYVEEELYRALERAHYAEVRRKSEKQEEND